MIGMWVRKIVLGPAIDDTRRCGKGYRQARGFLHKSMIAIE